jgi:hypothetical protein
MRIRTTTRPGASPPPDCFAHSVAPMTVTTSVMVGGGR